MAGHSKWANIKHRKKKQDKRRSKLFAKLIRAIEAAARGGDSDPDANPTLADAIQRAKDNDVPKDTIERAVKRGAGELDDGAEWAPVTYEGYSPGGVALLIECLTDNRNRTAADIRSALDDHEGSLADAGSVTYLFERRGRILVSPESSEAELLEAGLEHGLADLSTIEHPDHGEVRVAWCDPSRRTELRSALEDAGLEVRDANSPQVAETKVPVDETTRERLERILDTLDDLDDVQQVHHNALLPDEDEVPAA